MQQRALRNEPNPIDVPLRRQLVRLPLRYITASCGFVAAGQTHCANFGLHEGMLLPRGMAGLAWGGAGGPAPACFVVRPPTSRSSIGASGWSVLGAAAG